MARKRLGDLIREEAAKGLTPETNPTSPKPEASPAPNPKPAAAKTARRSAAKPTATAPTAAAPETTTAKPPAPDPVVDQLKTSLEKAEQALSLSQQHQEELKQQLAVSRQREQSLSQQLADWETKLAEQQAIAHRLQADLNQTEKLQTELKEAKQMILKLSAQPPAPVQPPATKSSEAIATKPKSEPKPEVYKFERIGWTPLSPHLIEPKDSPSKLNDIDLGWVD
jgi:predicted ribosome quality control (RQC) complex YloA/Tae2 family protein